MMNPLYCFRLDFETGKVTRYTIDNYVYRDTGYSHYHHVYSFKADIGSSQYHYDVRDEIIDRFVSQKIFSFNPDMRSAIEIIEETLTNKSEKAKRENRNINKLLKKIKEVNCE